MALLSALALSLVLVACALKVPRRLAVPGTEALRSLVAILAALVVFSLTIKGSGFIPALGVTGATPFAILIAGLASRETRWLALIVFALVLTTFCAVLFRFLLGLPLPLAPWVLGY